jgi:hypothetical protein
MPSNRTASGRFSHLKASIQPRCQLQILPFRSEWTQCGGAGSKRNPRKLRGLSPANGREDSGRNECRNERSAGRSLRVEGRFTLMKNGRRNWASLRREKISRRRLSLSVTCTGACAQALSLTLSAKFNGRQYGQERYGDDIGRDDDPVALPKAVYHPQR